MMVHLARAFVSPSLPTVANTSYATCSPFCRDMCTDDSFVMLDVLTARVGWLRSYRLHPRLFRVNSSHRMSDGAWLKRDSFLRFSRMHNVFMA